jgi:hypothetical protein
MGATPTHAGGASCRGVRRRVAPRSVRHAAVYIHAGHADRRCARGAQQMKRVGLSPSRFRRCTATHRYQRKQKLENLGPRPPIGELTGEHYNACRWGRATDAVLVPPAGGTHQCGVLSGRPPRTPSRNRPKPWFPFRSPKASGSRGWRATAPRDPVPTRERNHGRRARPGRWAAQARR